MAIFPSDKTQPFVAENGVVYVYEDDRWRVKTYKVEEDTRLPYRLETDKVLRIGDTTPQSTTAEVQLVDNLDNFTNVKFTGTNGLSVTSDAQGLIFDGSALIGDISLELDDYETKVDSQAGDQNLQNQIDDLSVSKGKVARYQIVNNVGTPVARPGQLSVNTTFPNNVVLVSFGIEDLDGVLTKPMATGDIIEFVDAASSKVSRYKITDAAGAPTGVGVEYISGDNDFAVDEEEQVYIYPQNESGASKDYVDAQDALHLPLAGGTLSGTVNSKLVKCVRDSGFAFEVKPNDTETLAYLHTDGRVTCKRLSVEGMNTPSSRAFQVMGEMVDGGNPSYNFFYMYTNATGTPDAINYQGKMDSEFNIVNVKFVRDSIADIDISGVELWGGSSPPPSSDRGTLLLTSSNQLYIYTS